MHLQDHAVGQAEPPPVTFVTCTPLKPASAQRALINAQVSRHYHALKRTKYTTGSCTVASQPLKWVREGVQDGSAPCTFRGKQLRNSSKQHALFGVAHSPGLSSLDPFDSTPIKIDAKVLGMIELNRSFFQPSPFVGNQTRLKASSFEAHFQNDTCSALQSRGVSYAFLSRYTTVAARVTGDQKILALGSHFKSKALKQLQQDLNSCNDNPPETVLQQITLLAVEELCAHNFEGAAVHGQALCNLVRVFEQPSNRHLMSVELMHSVLGQDVQRTAMTFTRTQFDLDKLSHDLESLSHTRSHENEFNERLDNLSESQPPMKIYAFQDAMLDFWFRKAITQCSAFECVLSRGKSVTTRELLLVSTRSLLVEGYILNHLAQAMDERNSGKSELSMPVIHQRCVVYLCLLYSMRRATRHESLIDIKSRHGVTGAFDFTSRLLERLDQAMSAWKNTNPKARQTHSECWLWCLSVGAAAEQGQRLSRVGTAWGEHYIKDLQEVAQEMSLETWGDVREILEKFLYNPAAGQMVRKQFQKLRLDCIER